MKEIILAEVNRLTELDRQKNLKKVMELVKTCEYCGELFLAKNKGAKTCSPKCRRLKWKEAHKCLAEKTSRN